MFYFLYIIFIYAINVVVEVEEYGSLLLLYCHMVRVVHMVLLIIIYSQFCYNCLGCRVFYYEYIESFIMVKTRIEFKKTSGL